MIKFINPHQTLHTLQQLAINTNQTSILITELITEIFGGYRKQEVKQGHLSSQEMNGSLASTESYTSTDFYKTKGEVKYTGKSKKLRVQGNSHQLVKTNFSKLMVE